MDTGKQSDQDLHFLINTESSIKIMQKRLFNTHW